MYKRQEHIRRSFGYFSNGIRLAAELGCEYMEVNSGWGYWNEDKEEAWKRLSLIHILKTAVQGVAALKEYEKTAPEGTALFGHSWQPDGFEVTDEALLDKTWPDKPVAVSYTHLWPSAPSCR